MITLLICVSFGTYQTTLQMLSHCSPWDSKSGWSYHLYTSKATETRGGSVKSLNCQPPASGLVHLSAAEVWYPAADVLMCIHSPRESSPRGSRWLLHFKLHSLLHPWFTVPSGWFLFPQGLPVLITNRVAAAWNLQDCAHFCDFFLLIQTSSFPPITPRPCVNSQSPRVYSIPTIGRDLPGSGRRDAVEKPASPWGRSEASV